MKKVLVLPGGPWQVYLVNKIKEMGYQALVINPLPNSPCFKVADKYLQANIFDWNAVISFARNEAIDAVVTDGGDIAVPVVARVAEELHLPTITVPIAKLFTNKYLMRDFCKKNGINHPEYALCSTVQEAIDFYKTIGKRMIIKPLDSYSSKGVYTINSVSDIIEHFHETLSFSRYEKKAIIERYIQGTEFTIDGIKTPYGYYPLAISEKKHFSHNENVANELLYSYYNEQFDYDMLRTENTKFVLCSGLKYGMIHAEYKYEDGKYYLIEIAARGGGNAISPVITNYMSGHDTQRYLVECALGNTYKYDFSINEECKQRASVLKFFNTPSGGGIVKRIDGIDEVRKLSDVVRFELEFNIGDRIVNADSDASRIGFYIACSKSINGLKNTMSKIDSCFKIKVD